MSKYSLPMTIILPHLTLLFTAFCTVNGIIITIVATFTGTSWTSKPKIPQTRVVNQLETSKEIQVKGNSNNDKIIIWEIEFKGTNDQIHTGLDLRILKAKLMMFYYLSPSRPWIFAYCDDCVFSQAGPMP